MFGKLTSMFGSRDSDSDSDSDQRRTSSVTIAVPKNAASRWGKSTSLPRHQVRVVDIERETPEAVTLILEPLNGQVIPFSAGQYLTHCFDVDGASGTAPGTATAKRAYSISVAEGKQLACTIKVVEGGMASHFVHDSVEIGHEYTVIGPSGDFLLPAGDLTPLAFLAAGSGITPVMSMIETALHRNPDRQIDLVYASRRQSDIIFAERLAKLDGDHPSLTVTHVLSRPDNGWTGRSGRLDGEGAAELLLQHPESEIYLCGPEELMADTVGALRAAGVTSKRIHEERYYTSARRTTPLPTIPQPIEFRRSNLTVIAQPGETILEAGLREGVNIDFSCTVGGCGACKVHMASPDSGYTVDEPNCLTDEEKANGYTLACSAYALEPVVVDA